MITQEALKSLTPRELRVLRLRFGLEVEEENTDQADGILPPVDEGGDEGGGVPAPADPPD